MAAATQSSDATFAPDLPSEIAAVLDVEPGDHVDVEAEQYQWANALEVDDVQEAIWHVPFGDDWLSRRVVVVTSQSEYVIDVGPGAGETPPEVQKPDGWNAGQLHWFAVDGEDEEDEVDFTARPPQEIIDQSPLDESLEFVLDEVEKQDTIIEVHRRFGSVDRLSNTRDLLFELGFAPPNQTRLETDATLAVRIPALREVAGRE